MAWLISQPNSVSWQARKLVKSSLTRSNCSILRADKSFQQDVDMVLIIKTTTVIPSKTELKLETVSAMSKLGIKSRKVKEPNH